MSRRRIEPKVLINDKLVSARWARKLKNKKKNINISDYKLTNISKLCQESSLNRNNNESDLINTYNLSSKTSSLHCPSLDDVDSNGVNMSFSENDSSEESLFSSDDDLLEFETSYEEPDTNKTFCNEYRILINEYPTVPRKFITKTLKLINKYKNNLCHEPIPNDSRSLMQTPRNMKVEIISNDNDDNDKATFYYFGIEKTLRNYLGSIKFDLMDEILLDAHIDGVEADKSSGLQHWPILGKIINIKQNIIFTIALHTGFHKPLDLNQYLNEFVSEVINLSTSGFFVNEKLIKFKLTRVLGDAPAKSFFLNTIGSNAYNSCLRCDVVGTRIENRISFYLSTSDRKKSKCRDCITFNNNQYCPLQKGATPLSQIPYFNCLLDCPFDSLHLIYIGTFKRMIKFWLGLEEYNKTKSSTIYRLSHTLKGLISNKLIAAKTIIPEEFQKKTDSLYRLKSWKACHFRFLLLYGGIVFFKGNISRKVYNNFLLLHYSIRTLNSKSSTRQQIESVRDYLIQFIKGYSSIYGKTVVSYNVHSLLHVVDDVLRHGLLDSYSTFLFESHLSRFKHYTHSSKNVAQQIVNRISEQQMTLKNIEAYNNTIIPTNPHDRGPVPVLGSFTEFSKLAVTNLFTINVLNEADNIVSLKDDTFVRVNNILLCSATSKLFLYGYKIINKVDYYTLPQPSSSVGIYLCPLERNYEMCRNLFSVDLIACKCVGIPTSSGIVIMKMLH